MEVRSPSDTYHILYKHDTSKVSTTLLTQMLPPSLTSLVVKRVIPFMLLTQQREINLCLSVCLNDARVVSLGMFKDNICTTRIHKEKKSLQSSSRSF